MTSDVQVVAGTVSAKTDRLEGIVDFTEQQVTGLHPFSRHHLLSLIICEYFPREAPPPRPTLVTPHLLGPPGEPEPVELQHQQAHGAGHEDHPPHQQGRDGT